ncbi:hypothetical protein QBC44DRAFT_157971 [Cladorrhinum sp. PSN332]|nr:hypothetical protein QBC44DRAFT_157971 [Cladorrhinum sp. PSN332]
MRLSTLPFAFAIFITATTTTTAAAAAGVQAQANNGCQSVALQYIPSCAQPCFVNKAPEIGCGGLDFVCQCQKQAALYAAIEGCVVDSCASDQYQAVIDGAGKVCECAVVASPSFTVSGSYVSHISSVPASSIVPSSAPTPSSGSSGSATDFDDDDVVVPTGVAFPAVTPASSKNAGDNVSPPSRVGVGMMGVSAFVAALAFAVL